MWLTPSTAVLGTRPGFGELSCLDWWPSWWEPTRVIPCLGLRPELVISEKFSAHCCSLSLRHMMILLRTSGLRQFNPLVSQGENCRSEVKGQVTWLTRLSSLVSALQALSAPTLLRPSRRRGPLLLSPCGQGSGTTERQIHQHLKYCLCPSREPGGHLWPVVSPPVAEASLL